MLCIPVFTLACEVIHVQIPKKSSIIRSVPSRKHGHTFLPNTRLCGHEIYRKNLREDYQHFLESVFGSKIFADLVRVNRESLPSELLGIEAPIPGK